MNKCFHFFFAVITVIFFFQSTTYSQRTKEMPSPLEVNPDISITFTTPVAPIVFTDDASNITTGSARLNGRVNPQGNSTNYQFLWGTSPGSLTNTTILTNAGSGNSLVPVLANLSSLSSATIYYYKLKGVNTGGTTFGSILSFKTLPLQPDIVTFTAGEIGTTYATLRGSADPEFDTTLAWFRWGRNDTILYSTDTLNIGAGFGPYEYTIKIDNLEPGTTYSFFAAAMNGGGVSNGNIVTFTTLTSPFEYEPDYLTYRLYHMNESSGDDIQDYGPDHHNANAYNSVSNPPPQPGEGQYGNGRLFTTSDQYISIPNNLKGDFVYNNFTLEAWVKPNLQGFAQFDLFNRGSPMDSDACIRFYITFSGALEMRVSEDGINEYSVTTQNSVITDGKWQHVAAVVDFGIDEILIYVNGIQQTTTAIGVFPGDIFPSPHPVIIGSFGIPSLSKSSSTLSLTIDEVRITEVALDPEDFIIPGSVSGTVFNDLDGDGDQYFSEPGLENWGVVLTPVSPNDGIPTSTSRGDTVYTDANGYYIFANVRNGNYQVKEIRQPRWKRTYPGGNGKHYIEVEDQKSVYDINFGNKEGHVFQNPGGSWSNPANWEGNSLPDSTDFVYINTDITYDQTSPTKIRGLELDSTSTFTFNSSDTLYIDDGGITVEDSASLNLNGAFSTMAGSTPSTIISVSGDFIVDGNFDAGTSTIIMTGESKKIVSLGTSDFSTAKLQSSKDKKEQFHAFNNQFYNLEISGDSTFADGDITITNNLLLHQSFYLEDGQTINLTNDDPGAIVDNGYILAGSVRRAISTVSAPYRFESVDSYIQFDNASGMPDHVTATTQPGEHPDTNTLRWKVKGGTVDTVNNTITLSGVNEFSRWVFGKPGTGFRKLKGTSSEEQYGTPQVSRSYKLTAENGSNFDATIQLRYEDDEVYDGETDLEFLRGPFYEDSVYTGWNIVSVPVVPEYSDKATLFPSSISNAFKFTNSGGYASASSLSVGTGYWLKYGSDTIASILGDEFSSNYHAVEEGWNIVGGLTYDVDPNSAGFVSDTSYTYDVNPLNGVFFAYQKGYKVASTLSPLYGYWVKFSEPGYLYLQYSGGTLLKNSSSSNSLSGLGELTIADNGVGSQTLYFGSKPGLNIHRYDMPPVPPEGSFDARFGTNTLAITTTEKGNQAIRIKISSAVYPVSISWNKNNANGNALLLVDGKATSLSGKGNIIINDAGSDIRIKITEGASDEIPTSFALYQNYPNPFNPSTTLSFDLPKDENITLKIYNILGQEVFSLIDNVFYKAGHYTQSVSTSSLASGVYFYKLTAGTFTATKKMILSR